MYFKKERNFIFISSFRSFFTLVGDMSEIKDKNYADVSGDKQGRKLIEDKKMSKGKIYSVLNI